VSGDMLISEEIVSKFEHSSPADNPSGDKTYTADLNSFFGSFDDATLCLCFPPGEGSVTLKGVKLLPPGQ
jgi:hypothetical protein